MVARPVEARPPAAPLSFQKKVGGKKGQGGGFRVPPPCTHPLDRPRRGNCDSPFLEFPPSCSTGNSPAAKAYFVTPPPLGAGVKIGAPAATQRSGRRGERRPSGGNELSGLPGSERSVAWADDVGRGILDAPFPSRHKHRSISAAWHRRRPGGPSRYSAALCRDCRVTAMRATRGAAAPVT